MLFSEFLRVSRGILFKMHQKDFSKYQVKVPAVKRGHCEDERTLQLLRKQDKLRRSHLASETDRVVLTLLYV